MSEKTANAAEGKPDEPTPFLKWRKRPFPFGATFRDSSLARLAFPQSECAKVNNWVKAPKGFLYVAGNPGLGKTDLCAALWKWFDEMPWTISMRYWKEQDFLKRIRSSISEASYGDYSSHMQPLMDDDLILFDDLGSTGVPSEWRQEVIFEFINYRYENALPTVITTNLPRNPIPGVKGSLKDFYHDRIASRIYDRRNVVIEMFDGPDHRQSESRASD